MGMKAGPAPFGPPGIELDRAAIRSIIASMCELWEKDEGAGGNFRAELDAARAVAIHTHAHHAVRMSRALLVLDDASDGAEVAPIIRLILECGVTAAWLLLTDGSGQSMIKAGSTKRRTALITIAKLGWDVNESLIESEATIADLDKAGVVARDIFEQYCNALHSGTTLYALYRVFSAESHAGMRIADLYTVTDDQSPIGVAFAANLPDEARKSALGIAASLLFVAINADEIARAKPRRSTQLGKIAKRLGVSVRIVGANGFEHPHR
jgi:hypothetical protein